MNLQNYPFTTEQEKQIAIETISYLTQVLNWLPTDLETAYLGVRAITINLAKQHDWDTVRAIYKDCPQLGMADIFSDAQNSDLPLEAKEELAELEKELQEGEITEKGFKKMYETKF